MPWDVVANKRLCWKVTYVNAIRVTAEGYELTRFDRNEAR
jgi:hypothetical protein